jgi:hypothetical protein
MPLLPIGLVPLGPSDLSGIELLGLLDVSMGANNFLAWTKKEENPGNVSATDPKLVEGWRATDGGGQRWPMIVPMLELEEAGGNQLVEHIVSAPKRLEEVEHRLLACFRGVEDNPILHLPSPTTQKLLLVRVYTFPDWVVR